MKLFAHILLVYIIFMAVSPGLKSYEPTKKQVHCCAADNDSHESDSPNKTTDCGACNPLLSCSCYCGFFVKALVLKFESVRGTTSQYSFYSSYLPSQLSYSIWQPPKL